MKTSTSKNIMKGVGAALAVCSALSMVSSTKGTPGMAKKAVKQTAKRVMDAVDTVSSFM